MVKEACRGRLLKVIVETCFLTEEEKIRMCGIVTDSGADYIKTSTGFGGGGATRGCGALCPAYWAACENQSCRRDRRPARCAGVH